MASLLYDTLLGTAQNVEYIDQTAADDAMYPLPEVENVLGPLYVPRVYARNLTAFEIGSSGKVAMSLNDAHTFDFTRAAFSNTSLQGITLGAASNYAVTLAGGGGAVRLDLNTANTSALLTATSNVCLTSTAGDAIISSSSNVTTVIAGTTRLIVGPTGLTVQGDINVAGTVNALSNITLESTTMRVQDKVVQLAALTDSNVADGSVTNGGAGIIVAGLPAVLPNSNVSTDTFAKKFTWEYGGDGVASLGTAAGIDAEPTWDLRGGALQITHKKIVGDSNVQDVAFKFRVNERDELEFVKKFWDNTESNYVTRRIARFGKIV